MIVTPGLHTGQHPDCLVCDAARQSPALSEQMHQAWTKCADCGVLGRKHPASGDHPFRPEKLRAVK